MKFLKLTLFLVLFVFGGSRASSSVPVNWIKQLADVALASHNDENKDMKITAASLDKVTYTLVDSTLFLMQLTKTGIVLLDAGFEDPVGPLFDFAWNTTRVQCAVNGSCVQENINMQFGEPRIGGLNTIKLYTDFQLDKLNLTLRIDDFTLDTAGYRHVITNNASGIVRIGERSVLALRNATYAITANYQVVPQVGIQVSNVNITLNIGEETWTVVNRYTVLENGETVDDGLYQGDLKQDVMSIWTGEYEGEPFEKKYEQWAEFLINCGLSGGRSNEACEDVTQQVNKFKAFFAKH